jgi:tRNA threonylcarbamoyladenosine biosynthesis protein TsaB
VILLAIESATDAVGAAVLGPGGTAVERIHRGGREHAERLAPAIQEACAGAGCALADVTVIAVDVGPGLFTGLRVGVATAKALGHGLGSLDVLAAAVLRHPEGDDREGGGPTAVAAVVDARRGEVFAATYERSDLVAAGRPGGPRTGVTDPGGAVAPEALPAWFADVAARSGGLTVVGGGAIRYADLLGPVPGVDLDRAERFATPSPAVLARLAADRLDAGCAPQGPAEVVPDYRRPPDATINWEQRAAPGAGPG